MNRIGLAAWIATGTLALACGGSDEVTSTESDHTAGEYIQANHPLFWNDSDYTQFRTITDEGSWSPNPQPVGTDDLAQRWLQAWTDRIDALVREKVLADTGAELVAPKPIMHLLPSSSISNAWVTAVPACVPWKVRARGAAALEEGQEPVDGKLASTLLFNHYGKKVAEASRARADGSTLCVSRDDFAPFAARFITDWNQGTPACPANLADDGVVEIEPSCLGEFSHASASAIYAISPHVQFASDLLAAGSEGGAVFVVAHELAHYYRAHGSPLARHKYGFWYDQDARTARRPVPAKDAAELEKLYREVEAMPRANALSIEGANHTPRYRALVLETVCSYVGARAGVEGIDASCTEAAALCKTVAPLRYAGQANAEQSAAYLQLETTLEACGVAERLGSVEEPAVASLVRSLQGKGYLPAGPVEAAPLPESFGALLTSLAEQARAQDDKVARFAERLRLGRIGLYTTEQEADELALEWVNLLGFRTQDALEGWIDYLRYFQRGYAPRGEPSAVECKELLDSDFKQGRAFVTVWLGDLNSAHHGGCYRVYNMWREQRAHRYVPAETVARPDFATWEQVLEQAKTLSR